MMKISSVNLILHILGLLTFTENSAEKQIQKSAFLLYILADFSLRPNTINWSMTLKNIYQWPSRYLLR